MKIVVVGRVLGMVFVNDLANRNKTVILLG